MEKGDDEKRIAGKPAVRSILASAAVPMSVFPVASVPVDVLGGRQRGLVAVAIAPVGALLALCVTAGADREGPGRCANHGLDCQGADPLSSGCTRCSDRSLTPADPVFRCVRACAKTAR